MPSKTSPIYQLKITLNNIHPPIWRRFLVSSNTTLGRLHDFVQVIMGWTDSHPHQFTIQTQIYGDPEDDEYGDLGTIDEWDKRLKQVILKAGQRFVYEYDFGDGWKHIILVEKILPPDPAMRWPVCLEGERACPPEDVGGMHGYAHFLKAIRNPRHEEHDEYLVWVGGAFNPEMFDLQAVNRRLRRLNKHGTLNMDDWTIEPEYPKSTPLTLPSNITWLDDFNRQYQSTTEALPLRQDMLTLLHYLQTNHVIGTQSTGNLPLKAAEALCTSFYYPVPFGYTIGKYVHKARSASEVWPLFFLHSLALAGGLVKGGPARRWKLTDLGMKFLLVPAGVQVWMLFTTWWTQVNWGIAASHATEDFPTLHLRPIARQHLLNLPLEHPLPFDLFADQFIAAARLSWPTGDAENQRTILHSLIKSIIAEPLCDFGVLELTKTPHPKWGNDIQVISEISLSSFGRELLLHMEDQAL